MKRLDVYNKLVRRVFTLDKADILTALHRVIRDSGMYPEIAEQMFLDTSKIKLKMVKDDYDEDDANIPDGITIEVTYEVEQELKP